MFTDNTIITGLITFSFIVVTLAAPSGRKRINADQCHHDQLRFRTGDKHSWINVCGDRLPGFVPGPTDHLESLQVVQNRIDDNLPFLNDLVLSDEAIKEWEKYEDRFSFLPEFNAAGTHHDWYKAMQIFIAAFEHLMKAQQCFENNEHIEVLTEFLQRVQNVMCALEYEFNIDFSTHLITRTDMNHLFKKNYIHGEAAPNKYTNTILNIEFTKKICVKYLNLLREEVESRIFKF